MNTDTADSRPLPLKGRTYFNSGGGLPWTLPDDIKAVRNGEGEWQITLRVFRDLGIVLGILLLGGVMA